jgi:hypothetical protein
MVNFDAKNISEATMGFYKDFVDGLKNQIGEGKRFKNNLHLANFCGVAPIQTKRYIDGNREKYLTALGKIIDALGGKLYFPKHNINLPAINPSRYRKMLQDVINKAIKGKYENYIDMAVQSSLSVKRVSMFMEDEIEVINMPTLMRIFEILDIEIRQKEQEKEDTQDASGEIASLKNQLRYADIALKAFENSDAQLKTLLSQRTQKVEDLKNRIDYLMPIAKKIVESQGRDRDASNHLAHEFIDLLRLTGPDAVTIADTTHMPQ